MHHRIKFANTEITATSQVSPDPSYDYLVLPFILLSLYKVLSFSLWTIAVLVILAPLAVSPTKPKSVRGCRASSTAEPESKKHRGCSAADRQAL